MNDVRLWSASIAIACLLLGIVAIPALALTVKPVAPQACDRVQFYLFNGFDGDIFVDVANWSTATRWVSPFFGPGEQAFFNLEPGVFEIYIDHSTFDHTDDWQLSEWDAYAACTKVGIYVKEVSGEPVLNVHSMLVD
jgi:hypothetical protein